MQAFVGIVSQQGIELFVPEDPATVKFLMRRVQRARRPMACFWSVLSQDAAAVITGRVNHGQAADALDLLLQQARECGLILPRVRLADEFHDAYPA